MTLVVVLRWSRELLEIVATTACVAKSIVRTALHELMSALHQRRVNRVNTIPRSNCSKDARRETFLSGNDG